MSSASFFADLSKPSAPSSSGSFFGDLTAKEPDAKTRNAQPTAYEREHASDVEAWQHPLANVGEGLAKSLLSAPTAVGEAIHAIPGIGSALVPESGLQAEKNLGAAKNPIQDVAKQEGDTIQSAAVPWGKIAEPAVAPVARFVGENILPEVRGIPYIGRGIKAAEEAPTAAKAAIRAGTTGALLGGVERGIQTRDPMEALKGAAYGGGFGALAGLGAYGINRAATGIPISAPEPTSEPIVSSEPFRLAQEEGPLPKQGELPLEFPNAQKLEVKPGEPYNATPAKGNRIPTMQDLTRLIEQEGAGAKPLQRNVPIGQQVPAKFPEVGQVPLGNRVALDVRDLGEQRINAPEKMPTIPQEEVGRNMGAPPLQSNRPLREQFKPDAEAMAHQSEQSRLEEKYPDKAMRQMVHANGEEMVDAIGDDADTLRAIHDLRNPDVRQAMINAGEDMGQKTVSNRKAMGEGSISRQDAFRQLLKKGYTPQQIIELSQPPEEVGVGAKPGPQRAGEWRKLEREAGD